MADCYNSPRLSSEYYECGLPFTFDAISRCSYGCLYCFAGPIKDSSRVPHGEDDQDYGGLPDLSFINIPRFRRLFQGAPEDLSKDQKAHRQAFVDQHLILHWGGLADAFDHYALGKYREKTLEVLRFLTDIKWPVLFSSKGAFWQDEELLEVFAANAGRWGFQSSIITYDPEIARKIEVSAPSPQDRIKTVEALSKRGIRTILRFRPFCPGISTGTWRELLTAAADAGAKALSTEFLCIPFPDFEFSRRYFDRMGKAADFDFTAIYKAMSRHARGQPRLSRHWKKPYVYGMWEECEKRGVRFACSDPDYKELTNASTCCGLSPEDLEGGQVTRGTFTEAIRIAFRRGSVRFADISGDARVTLDPLQDDGVRGKDRLMRKLRQESVFDRVRGAWNIPTKSAMGVYNFFDRVLVPAAVDSNNDLVYFFDYKRGLYETRTELEKFGVAASGLEEFGRQMAGALPGGAELPKGK